MPEPVRIETSDSEIDAALKRAREFEKYDRRVVKAQYLRSSDRLRIRLNDGASYSIPRRLVQGLSRVRSKWKLSNIQILGNGSGLLWPLLDVSHLASALFEGRYGTQRWMSQLADEGMLNGHESRNRSSASIASMGTTSYANRSAGRYRDNHGRLVEKRGSTLVGTLRRVYGDDFLSEWRSDAKLSAVKAETDMSLPELVRNYRIGKKSPKPEIATRD